MSWIHPRDSSPGNRDLMEILREALSGYPPEYGASVAQGLRLPDAVKNDSVVLAHSLVPDALRHVFAGYRAMLAPELPLSRRQHEMIAATVSILNDCYY